MTIDPKDLSIHDDVAVETEIDGEIVSLPAFVTNVLSDELWLAMRPPDAPPPEPPPLELDYGRRLHLTFNRGGKLVVESEFLRWLGGPTRQSSGKALVFAVRRPQGVESVQRRAHVRVDLDRVVRIKSLGGDGMGTGWTGNIGAGGVQFTTTMPLAFGEQLRLALVLSARDIVIASGPVVRIEPVPVAASPGAASPGDSVAAARVAVRFDRITETDQERITCHILAAQRARAAPHGSSAGASYVRASAPAPGPAPDPAPPPDAVPEAAAANQPVRGPLPPNLPA